MAEQGETTTTETKTETKSGLDDAAFAREEAKKAFAERDKFKKELRELKDSGRVISDEQAAKYKELEDAAAKAEEDRKKKAGEFDSLRESLLKKHDAELAAEKKRAEDADARLRKTLIGLSFAQASDWFGPQGKTVLTPEIAEAFYGRYVELDGDQVIVKDLSGAPIVDVRTGKPARFADAIGELITSLPNKDHVLRGSGKTGSGSSGGSGGTSPTTDLAELTARARKGDKSALEALRQHQDGLGGIKHGAGVRRAS
jgi:hypothetical protein